jgi:tellurite resistance protein TerC
MTLSFISGPGPWLALAGITVALLLVDLKLFAPDRTPTFREGAYWSIGWLVLALAVAPLVWALSSADDAVTYTTIYFVERSLSLDNLFVFLLLFSYFAVPEEHRANLLFYGIVAALALRGLAILGGVALIEQFHWVIYALGLLLLVLAYRILRGVEEGVDPDKNLIVRAVRKVFPVADHYDGHHWFTRVDGQRYATPIFVCLAAIVAADIAFAIDSIPAAFAITRDSVLIWMANIFALLGLRALFVLVEGLVRRFRYLDETIAIVLALVAVKLLLEDTYKVGHVASLGVVAAAFTIGIVASLIVDKREAARGSGGDGLPAGHPDGDDGRPGGEREHEQAADRHAPAEGRH